MIEVIGGSWKNGLAPIRRTLGGRLKHIKLPKGFLRRERVLAGDIDAVEVVTHEDRKSALAKAGAGLAGGVLLGGVGAFAGLLGAGNRNLITVLLTHRDGRQAMLRGKSQEIQVLLAAAIEPARASRFSGTLTKRFTAGLAAAATVWMCVSVGVVALRQESGQGPERIEKWRTAAPGKPRVQSRPRVARSVPQGPHAPRAAALSGYEVLQRSFSPSETGKASFDVLLEQPAEEVRVRGIATQIRNEYARHRRPVFVTFYLGDRSTVGDRPAYSVVRFDPDIHVNVIGLTASAERELETGGTGSGSILGRWVDRSTFAGGIITIREDLKMIRRLKGGIHETQLREVPVPHGRRFDPVRTNAHGDHWLLLPSGDLQVRDNEGLIRTAKKK